MKVEITRSLPEETWRQFVMEQPHGNIFQTPEMFAVFERTQGYSPALWAAVDDGGRVLALLIPVRITLSRWLSSFTSRAIVPGSVLCDPSPEGQEALAQLLQTYKRKTRNHVLFTELRNLSNLEVIQPVLQDHGFLYEEHLNYLIDLKRPAQDILESMGKRTRKHIRQGLRKQNVVIEEVREPQGVSVCYALLDQTYRAAKVPLADPSLFEALFDLLVPIGMARFTLARVDQNYVSTSIDLVYKDVIYGWYGGTDRDYSAYRPTGMITWDAIRWGAENGYRIYDLGGAGKPDEESGVRDFKAKFGGDLVCFGRNTYIHAPFKLRLSSLAYSLYQRLL